MKSTSRGGGGGNKEYLQKSAEVHGFFDDFIIIFNWFFVYRLMEWPRLKKKKKIQTFKKQIYFCILKKKKKKKYPIDLD